MVTNPNGFLTTAEARKVGKMLRIFFPPLTPPNEKRNHTAEKKNQRFLAVAFFNLGTAERTPQTPMSA